MCNNNTKSDRKIKIGLHLSGKDADDFIKYMRNPIFTKDADEAMQNAILIDKLNNEQRHSENARIIITDTNMLKDKEIRNVSKFYIYTTGLRNK